MIIGIDLGGTKIKGLAVTTEGTVLARAFSTTGDKKASWPDGVRRVKQALEKKVGRKAEHVGVAAPGLAARDEQSIAFMPGRLPGLQGLIWADYLESRTPVPVLNDAHAALLGERWLGAARHTRNAILLTLGTGVGGAALVDGHLLRGHIGRAGHLGHISLDPNGHLDITGTPGSLEDAIGDCTIARRTRKRFASTAKLVEAAKAGDAQALRIWRESVKALAAGIAGLINVLDPEVVVIGGGISRAGLALFAPLAEFLERFEWRPGGQITRIEPARLGDMAGAFGAAWRALHFQKT